MNGQTPRLPVEKKDLYERDVLVIPKSGDETRWNFTLPVIVESTELVLLLEPKKSDIGKFRAKGPLAGESLSVNGKRITQAWVVVVGTAGREVELVRKGASGERTEKVKIVGGDTLQIVNF